MRLGRRRGSNDRTIGLVMCPCSWHWYDWQSRSYFARTETGPVAISDATKVPVRCRKAFDARVAE